MKLVGICFFTLLVVSSQALPVVVNPVSESVGLDTVTLTWNLKGGDDEEYQIDVVVKEYHQAENPNIKGEDITLQKGSTRATVTNLKSGTTYAAIIRPMSSSDTGSDSVRVVFTTDGIKPPRDLEITTITDKMITFEWSPPTGIAIDATRIRLKNNQNGVINSYEDQLTPISEYTIKGLTPGNPYIVMIQAKSGNKLSTVLQMGLRTAVGTISSVRMSEIDSTTAVAEWNSPTAREGTEVSHYEVVLVINHANNSTEQPTSFFTPPNQPGHTNYKLKDLLPDRFYAIKVRAVYKSYGHGPFSKPTFFQTVRQEKPTTPTNIKVFSVTKKSAEITWSKPDYKHDILDYEVQYAKKDTRPEPILRTSKETLRYVLGGLESGTDYTVRVRGIGKHSIVGVWSVQSTFKTMGPKPVSSVSLTEIKDTSVKVSWTTYTGSNASKFVIKYKITDSENDIKSIEADGNVYSKLIDDLKPTTPYEVLVYLIDSDGVLSTPVQHGLRTNINIDVLSEAPKNVKLEPKASNTRIEVSFKKVPNRLVKFYEVQIEGFDIANVPFFRQALWPPNPASDGSRQSGELKDIQSGWEYKVTVRPVYGNDETGTWSTPAAIKIPGPRPPRVINIFEITEKSAEVHWKSGYEKSDANVPNNLKYNVTLYRFIGDSKREQFVATKLTANENNVMFEQGIEPSTRYNVRIFSEYNDGGDIMKSTKTELAFRSDSARPPPPVLISRSVTDTSATIFWNRIPNRSDIKHYEIHLKELNSETSKQFTTSNALEESYTFQGLTKKVFYEFKVRAVVSTTKKGKWLIATFYVPGEPIKQVEGVNILKKSSRSVTLVWKAGVRADLERYEIEIKSEERGITETIVTNGLTNSFKLEDLHPGTNYQYRIRAVSVNENDKGEWSSMQRFRTERGSPLEGGMSKGVIIGIVLAAIAVIVLIIVAVMICRKRKGQPFEKFDGSVKFQRNSSQEPGGLPSQEMDDTATAIRNGKKLYI